MEDVNRYYRSPKANEMVSSRITNPDSIASPKSSMVRDNNLSFSELKNKYSWALNTIELLKLEKNNLKNTLDLAMHDRDLESSPKAQKFSYNARKSETLDAENAELKGQLDHHKSKLNSLQKENKKLHEKFSEIDRIQLYNSQLRNEMINLNSELTHISVKKRIRELEEENEYLLRDTKSASTQPQLSKYIDQTLHFLNGFDESHYARICFEQHFARVDLKNLIESKNYNLIALKAFKYITDLLLNVKPRSPSQEPKQTSNYTGIATTQSTERTQDLSKGNNTSSYSQMNIYDPQVSDFNASRVSEKPPMDQRVGSGMIRNTSDRPTNYSEFQRSTYGQQPVDRDQSARDMQNYSSQVVTNNYDSRPNLTPREYQKRKAMSNTEFFRKQEYIPEIRYSNDGYLHNQPQPPFVQESIMNEMKHSKDSLSSKKSKPTELIVTDYSDYSHEGSRKITPTNASYESYHPQPAFLPKGNSAIKSNSSFTQGGYQPEFRMENPVNRTQPNEVPVEYREPYYTDNGQNSFRGVPSNQQIFTLGDQSGGQKSDRGYNERSSEKRIVGRRGTEVTGNESQSSFQQSPLNKSSSQHLYEEYQQHQLQQQQQEYYQQQQLYQQQEQRYLQQQQYHQQQQQLLQQQLQQHQELNQSQNSARMRHNPSFGIAAPNPGESQKNLFFYSEHNVPNVRPFYEDQNRSYVTAQPIDNTSKTTPLNTSWQPSKTSGIQFDPYVEGSRNDIRSSSNQTPQNAQLLDKIQMIASQNASKSQNSRSGKKGTSESNTDQSMHERDESPHDNKSESKRRGSERSLKPILKQDPKFANSNIDIIDTNHSEEMLLPGSQEFQDSNGQQDRLNSSQKSDRGRNVPSNTADQQQESGHQSPKKSSRRSSPEVPQVQESHHKSDISGGDTERNTPQNSLQKRDNSNASLQTPPLMNKKGLSKIQMTQSENISKSPMEKIDENPDMINSKTQSFKKYSGNSSLKSSIMAEIKYKGSRQPRNSQFSEHSVVFGKTESKKKQDLSPENDGLYILDVAKRKKIEGRGQQYDPIKSVELNRQPRNVIVIEPLPLNVREDSVSSK